MAWWAWVVLGFVLLLGELLTPGAFFLALFGASAILVGFLVLLGIGEPAWLDWLLFSLFALSSVVWLRPILQRRFAPVQAGEVDVDNLVGLAAQALEAITPGGEGRVELRGAQWKARNIGTEMVAAFGRCRVVEVDGLVLRVRAEQ